MFTRSRSNKQPIATPAVSFVTQINTVVQELLKERPDLHNSRIELREDVHSGVRILINDTGYSGIDSLPDGPEKQLIRKAIAAWESGSTSVRATSMSVPQPAGIPPQAHHVPTPMLSPMSVENRCATCNHDLPEGSRFCPYCGNASAAQTRACTRCYTEVQPEWQYCNRCGDHLV